MTFPLENDLGSSCCRGSTVDSAIMGFLIKSLVYILDVGQTLNY